MSRVVKVKSRKPRPEEHPLFDALNELAWAADQDNTAAVNAINVIETDGADDELFWVIEDLVYGYAGLVVVQRAEVCAWLEAE